MVSNKPNRRWRRILKKSLLAVTLFLVVVLAAACLALAFLPRLASTDWARQHLTMQLEKSLGRPVEIRELDWTWADGIHIAGIRIADHPDFSRGPMVTAARARLDIQYRQLFSRCLNFTFLLQNPELRLIRDKSGRINLLHFLETLGPAPQPPEPGQPGKPEKKPSKEPSEEPSEEPFTLPLNVKTDIHLADGALDFADEKTETHYRVENLDIRLRVPSLAREPVRLTVAADTFVNERKLPRSMIDARIRDLFDNKRNLRPDQAAAEIKAEFPGSSLNISGDMRSSGIKADLSVDLEPLARAAALFAPQLLEASQVGGRITLNAEVSMAATDSLAFKTDLKASELAVGGELAGGRDLGPGRMGLFSAGEINLAAMDLRLDQARVELLENSRMSFQGHVYGMDEPSPDLDLTLAPLEIDLDELAAFAGGLIPEAIVLGESGSNPGKFSIDELRLSGSAPRGESELRIRGLSLALPDLTVRKAGKTLENADTGKQQLFVKGAGLTLEELSLSLVDLFPTQAQLKAAVGLDRLVAAAGENRILAKGLSLERIHLAASDIHPAAGTPAGLSGRIRLSTSALLEAFSLNDQLSIQRIRQDLDLNMELNSDGTMTAALPQFDLNTSEINLLHPDVGTFAAPAGLEMAVSRLTVDDMAARDITVEGLDTRLAVGKLLSLKMAADARQSGKSGFDAEAALKLDFAEILNAFSTPALAGLSAAGQASLNLGISGRSPGPDALAGLKKLQISENLDFLEHFRVRLGLADSFLDYQANADAPRIKIGKLSADPLFAYELSGKTAEGQLTGQLSIGGVEELFLLKPNDPLSGELNMKLRHHGASRIQGNQQFRIPPLDLRQSLEFSMDGLETALAQKTIFDRFKQISGRLAAKLDLGDSRSLNKLALPEMAAIETSGALGAGLALAKSPDNSLDFSIHLDAAELSAALDEQFSVSGLNSRIELAKTLTIEESSAAADPTPRNTWLSQEMMRADGAGEQNAPFRENRISTRSGRIFGNLRNTRGISFASAYVAAGGLPLDIGPSHVALELSRGLPQIPSFQIEALGGTLLGNCRLQPRPSGYQLETRLNFSGIDPAAIYPDAASEMDAASDRDAGASEISGSLFAALPVLPEMQQVLENAEIRFNFRKIGSRALERMLYALDPYESNEAIVSQRRLLRMGSPKQVELAIKDGFLSLSGEITVKSVPMTLPPLRRLNIAQIPGMNAYTARLEILETIVRALDLASADTLPLKTLLDMTGSKRGTDNYNEDTQP